MNGAPLPELPLPEPAPIGNRRECKTLRRVIGGGGLPGDVQKILEQRLEQIERHGHDDAADALRSPAELIHLAKIILTEAADVCHPGDRCNLDVAHRRLARAGAMVLAIMRRINRERG